MKNHRLAEIAMPHLEMLRQRTVWPSDLVVRHGYGMALLETTRSRAGLGLYRDEIGQHINMPHSAVGRAYLAFCPERERAMLIRHAFAGRRKLASLTAAKQPETALEKLLSVVRTRGYAVRDPLLGRRDENERLAEDHLAAIAVPILGKAAVFGCINLVWPKKFDLEERIVSRHLLDLQKAAAGLAQAVSSEGTAD